MPSREVPIGFWMNWNQTQRMLERASPNTSMARVGAIAGRTMIDVASSAYRNGRVDRLEDSIRFRKERLRNRASNVASSNPAPIARKWGHSTSPLSKPKNALAGAKTYIQAKRYDEALTVLVKASADGDKRAARVAVSLICAGQVQRDARLLFLLIDLLDGEFGKLSNKYAAGISAGQNLSRYLFRDETKLSAISLMASQPKSLVPEDGDGSPSSAALHDRFSEGRVYKHLVEYSKNRVELWWIHFDLAVKIALTGSVDPEIRLLDYAATDARASSSLASVRFHARGALDLLKTASSVLPLDDDLTSSDTAKGVRKFRQWCNAILPDELIESAGVSTPEQSPHNEMSSTIGSRVEQWRDLRNSEALLREQPSRIACSAIVGLDHRELVAQLGLPSSHRSSYAYHELGLDAFLGSNGSVERLQVYTSGQGVFKKFRGTLSVADRRNLADSARFWTFPHVATDGVEVGQELLVCRNEQDSLVITRREKTPTSVDTGRCTSGQQQRPGRLRSGTEDESIAAKIKEIQDLAFLLKREVPNAVLNGIRNSVSSMMDGAIYGSSSQLRRHLQAIKDRVEGVGSNVALTLAAPSQGGSGSRMVQLDALRDEILRARIAVKTDELSISRLLHQVGQAVAKKNGEALDQYKKELAQHNSEEYELKRRRRKLQFLLTEEAIKNSLFSGKYRSMEREYDYLRERIGCLTRPKLSEVKWNLAEILKEIGVREAHVVAIELWSLQQYSRFVGR